jgi:hypothetical protein
MQHDAAKAADVDRPRRRLGVVYYLGARGLGGYLIGPVHGAGWLTDLDDLVREVAGGDVHDDLIALVLAQ